MVLEVTHLRKNFGGVHAVRDVSFSVKPGECVALIGPNGAGKSTTFACIAGQHPATGGNIDWCGKSLDRLSPAQRLQLGVARTFQVAQTFEALTALQNVQLALQGSARHSPVDELSQFARSQAMQLLQEVGLKESAEQVAVRLPYGAKKRLELALSLAGIADKRHGGSSQALLLLDEPAAGLAADERADMMRLIQSLSARMALLYTEHNMDAVFGIADRVIVLIDGEIAAQGTPQDVARDPLVRTRYLGNSLNTLHFPGPADA
jgi:branched-chain amino acid transport system ATP-binding protein